MESWLPEIISIDDYGGDWNSYIEALYEVFTQDFKNCAPTFNGQPINLKRHPQSKGKEATFWHLLTSGDSEDSRKIDLRRCERIRWPKAIINSKPFGVINCWRTIRDGEQRHVLSLNDFSYVVVLAERRGYFLLWTAYCVEYLHRREKLKKEFERDKGKLTPP